jgi:hypothetical protein
MGFNFMWRFDQGRLNYFQFDEVKRIALALADLDGADKPISKGLDIVREVLSKYSSQPFAPENYYVWRNYGRVFEALLLSTVSKNKILATDLCISIANNSESIDCDDYLTHFAKNFYYPSPVFEGYTPSAVRTFPVIAIIKLLISEFLTKGKDYISIDEIVNLLIANEVHGTEDIIFFGKLQSKSINGYDYRQTRELVKFISQFSFLKWENPCLYLEINSREELIEIEQRLQPTINIQNTDAALEILQLGSSFERDGIGSITRKQLGSQDEEFTEGNKIRVTHLRTERSSKLKSMYFRKINNPQVCRICDVDTAIRYPWTDHVIELHHLLPLSSPVRVDSKTTSLKDLVGLCPSCHRATHKFYSKWLKENKVNDFTSQEQAIHVYNDIKQKIILNY